MFEYVFIIVHLYFILDGVRGAVKCTQGNCFNHFGVIIGDALFLAHGSERHPIILPQIGRWIAFNISHC